MKKQIILILLCFHNILAYSQTSVPTGNVFGTWTLAGSPYNIQGDIQIPNDSTLNIQAGVTVIFQGQFKFTVLGRLLAIGTVADTITFSSTNTTIGWRGIRFANTTNNNDTSRVKYCKIQYGKATATQNDNGGGFLFISFSKAVISHSLISSCEGNNFGGGIACQNSSPIISNNRILNNLKGINVYGGSPKIISNIISNNQCGINCNWCDSITINNNQILNNQGSGLYCMNSSPNINNNNFIGNIGINGGGIYLDCPNCTNGIVTNNLFIGNKATNGGGLYEKTLFDITHNTFTNDTASNGGGALYSMGTPNINQNNFSNNVASYGGAICGYASYATIDSNNITNNIANGSGFEGGGGILIYEGNPIVKNNSISNNTSQTFGGGISRTTTSTAATASIYDNKITNNSAYSGGGISTYISTTSLAVVAKIYRNFITNNSSSQGGGIYCYHGSPTITDNVISNNSSTGGTWGGGGVFLEGSNSGLVNNTISNNMGSHGGGIFLMDNSDAYIGSTIFWGNGQQIYLYDDTSDPNIYSSNIEGGATNIGYGSNVWFAGVYQNNISIDPLFINPTQGAGIGFNGLIANWALPSNSPCVDYGSNITPVANAIDIAKQYRWMNCKIDIGAYEFFDSTLTSPIILSNGPVSLCPGDSVTLTASNASSYLWNTGDTTQSITVSTNGNYDVSLTCNNSSSIVSNSINISVHPTPPTPTISLFGASLQINNPQWGCQWYLNSNAISGATTNPYQPLQNGSYTAITFSSYGCPSSISAPYNFITTSINEPITYNNIIIYPNPNNGLFYLEVVDLQILKVRIYNTIGQIVFESISPNSQFDLSAFPKEIYFIEVVTEEKTYHKKIIIH